MRWTRRRRLRSKRLSQTDEHRAATVVDAIQTRVEFLTQQGDRTFPDELAAAKKDLAEARDRLRRLEDRHLSNDPNVKNAEMKLAQAESAHRSAREDFEKQLDQRPEVADARKAEAAEQQNYDNALRAVRNAEARAGDASQQLARQDEAVALEQDQLKGANDTAQPAAGRGAGGGRLRHRRRPAPRDALDAVEAAPAASATRPSWSLARAERAADAFYGWGVPATGYGWSVVHVGLVDWPAAGFL